MEEDGPMALQAMRSLAQVLALGAQRGCAPRQAALEALKASQERQLRVLGVSVNVNQAQLEGLTCVYFHRIE